MGCANHVWLALSDLFSSNNARASHKATEHNWLIKWQLILPISNLRVSVLHVNCNSYNGNLSPYQLRLQTYHIRWQKLLKRVMHALRFNIFGQSDGALLPKWWIKGHWQVFPFVCVLQYNVDCRHNTNTDHYIMIHTFIESFFRAVPAAISCPACSFPPLSLPHKHSDWTYVWMQSDF